VSFVLGVEPFHKSGPFKSRDAYRRVIGEFQVGILRREKHMPS